MMRMVLQSKAESFFCFVIVMKLAVFLWRHLGKSFEMSAEMFGIVVSADGSDVLYSLRCYAKICFCKLNPAAVYKFHAGDAELFFVYFLKVTLT